MKIDYVLLSKKVMVPYEDDMEIDMCLKSTTNLTMGFKKELLSQALKNRPDWTSIGTVYRGNKHSGSKHFASLHRVENLWSYVPVQFKVIDVYEWFEGNPETYLGEFEGNKYFVYEITSKAYGIAALVEANSNIEALIDVPDLEYLKSRQISVRKWMEDKKLFTFYAAESIMSPTTFEWLNHEKSLPNPETLLGEA